VNGGFFVAEWFTLF